MPSVTFLGTPPSKTASTNGWDVVSAVRIADMNAAIAMAGTTPPGFSGGEGDDHVHAEFGPWAVGTGGDGANIHMLLPLNGLTHGGAPVSHAVAEVSLRLRFVPPARNDSGRDLRVLVVDPTPHGAEGNAQVLDIHYDKRPSVFVRGAVSAALSEWLQANLDQFRHVFACVDLTKAAPDESFQWLKPSVARYAMAALIDRDPGESVFGILCQTAGRKDSALEAKVSAAAIPDDHRAALLISNERFTLDMLRPAIPHAFEGVPLSGLVHKTDPERLIFDGDVKMKTVTADGKPYEPHLLNLDVTVHETSVAMHTISKTPVLPGIWSLTETNVSYGFGLLENKSGEKTMGLTEAEPPTHKSWHEHSKGIVILEWVLGLIALIAGAVLTVASLGLLTLSSVAAAAFLTGFVASIMGELIIKIADAVADGDGPPLSLLLSNATDAVSWAHGSVFDPDWAGLNGALQFAGRLGTPQADGRLGYDRHAIRAFQARFGVYQEELA